MVVSGSPIMFISARFIYIRQDSYYLSFQKIVPSPQHIHIIMPDQQQQPNQLNIEISEEVAEGNYANLAIITHSHAEFVVDFVNVMPGTPKSRVKSRIILTPQHAKRFMKALTENVSRFESANGSIKDLEEIQLPVNFGGPTAQA